MKRSRKVRTGDELINHLRKTEMVYERRLTIVLFILSMIAFQFALTNYQFDRYHYDEYGYEDYACVEMSRDCESFFEGLGIRVYQMTGELQTGEIAGEGGQKSEWHRWILLDIFGFQIPYESTALYIWDPLWEDGYTNVFISDGYILDGNNLYNETELNVYRLWDGHTDIFACSDHHIINDEHFDSETDLRNVWWKYQ